MDQVEHIPCGAAEPIQTLDHQLIPVLQEVEEILQFRAAGAGGPGVGFGANDLAPRCRQPGGLDVEILGRGADPRGAGPGHGSPVTIGWLGS